jgi:hypothetical protein
MKTKIRLIILAGLLLAIALGALFLTISLPGRARDTGHVPLALSPLDQWETYSDEEFGFLFKYPSGWYLESFPNNSIAKYIDLSNYDWDNPDIMIAYSKQSPEDAMTIEFVVILNEPLLPGQTLEEWRLSRGDLSPTKPRETQYIKVADIEALEEKIEYYPGGFLTTIYLPYNHKDYDNAVLLINVSNFRQPIMEDIFRQVVDSFEFVE